MKNSASSVDFEARLAALELRQQGINKELEDIREIVTNGYNLLFQLNGDRVQSIEAVVDFLRHIEMQLGPVFSKTFPEHDAYVDAIGRITGQSDKS